MTDQYGPRRIYELFIKIWLISTILIASAGFLAADTLVSGNIAGDTTWTAANSPYVVTGNVYVYKDSSNAATLTIEAGVTVKFNSNVRLQIGHGYNLGILIVNGTADAPVLFTSAGESPAPGDWGGIYFQDKTVDAKTVLNHFTVEYAGSGTNAGIYLENAAPTLNNGLFQENSGVGLYGYGSNSSAVIENSTFTNNAGSGIYFQDNSSPVIRDNTFIGNDEYGLRFHPGVNLENMTGNAGEGSNGIRIDAGTVNWKSTWHANDGLPYVVTGNVTVCKDSSTPAVLTIEAGSIVKFEGNTRLQIGYGYDLGTLKVNGTAAAPVLFTSAGDTPAPGDWRGIYFQNKTVDADTVLSHFTVEYAGFETKAGIYLENAAPTLKNGLFQMNRGFGLSGYGSTSSAVIENSTFTANAGSGIYFQDNASPVIRDNTFIGNDEYGLRFHPGVNLENMTGNAGEGSNGIRIDAGTVNWKSTWHANDGLPYVVAGNVTVCKNSSTPAVLTIEAGSIVKFKDNIRLQIGYGYDLGTLKVNGTADAPVLFTSASENPAPGDWQGISFHDKTVDDQTVLRHFTVEYAGCGTNAGIYLGNAAPTIENARFQENLGFGLAGQGSTSSAVIENSTFTANAGSGIYFQDNASPVIRDNTFIGNDEYGLQFHPGVNLENMTGNAGVTSNGIRIDGGTVNWKSTWHANDGLPYVVAGNVTVCKNSSTPAVLTIEAGSIVKFKDNIRLQIGYGYDLGTLKVNGTADAPVLFTSASENPAPGDWQGISFHDKTVDDQTVLRHFTVEYAGCGTNAGIYLGNAAPTIENARFQENLGFGLSGQGSGSSAVIKNSTFTANAGSGIYFKGNASPVIQDNTFTQNDEYGLRFYPDVNLEHMTGNAGVASRGIRMDAGTLNWKSTWHANEGLPYVVNGDLYVFKDSSTPAILTVEAGSIVKFEGYSWLKIGYGYDLGTLKVNGTADAPVLFTSASEAPAPGDWRGINFQDLTVDADTMLDHCVVEFAGQDVNGAILCGNASPTIVNTTVRASSAAGIYLSGTGCNNAVLHCNNLTENQTGIRLENSAAPYIEQNNFVGNSQFGIYNNTLAVTAANNWWNDVQGPGYAGDAVYGEVETAPWLIEPSDCVTLPPPNTAPFAPVSPVPADQGTQVALTDGTLALSWQCSDPNPWDVLTYDLYFGTGPDSLVLLAQDLSSPGYTVSDLALGTWYYWQVVAKDAAGEATASKVFRFLTQGPPPDLTVSAISWEPAQDIQSGTPLVFTAKIENTGEGPLAVPVNIAFLIDENPVRTSRLNQVMMPGDLLDVTWTWKSTPGYHTITVNADSSGEVEESDELNNALSQALPLIADTTPPEDATGLAVQCFNDRLLFSWTHSANTYGDLSGYRVYIDGQTEGTDIPASQAGYELTGLAPATRVWFRITALDFSGNESAGVQLSGITWLPNPVNLISDPHSGYVNLTWDGAEPSELVKQYRIYISDSDFSDVTGLSPAVTATGLSAGIAGLTNNTTYYMAVTTVNLSGGENTGVATICAVPVPDTQGPSITDTQWDSDTFQENMTLGKTGWITLTGSDPAGISQVSFLVDGNLVYTDNNGSTTYSCRLSLEDFSDGAHILTITAMDSLGNVSSKDIAFTIDLDLPDPPVLVSPEACVTGVPVITATGTAPAGSILVIFVNGQESAQTDVGDDGNFSVKVGLTEGLNRIQACARNRKGDSALTTAVSVTLDTAIPMPPTHLSATAGQAGVIRLSWQSPEDTGVKGYNIYRSNADFSLPADAVAVNSSLALSCLFNDLPPEDGTWIYRIAAVDTAGNESLLSEKAQAVSDRVMPFVEQVEFVHSGFYDAVSQRMGTGVVNVVLTLSEPLLTTPFFSLTPTGGNPIIISLTKTDDTQYEGGFSIDTATPSGQAWAIFSGRDLVGNRGTEIQSGKSVLIDTQGPVLTRIAVDPPAPVQNDPDEPASLTVTLGLDEAVKSGTVPALSYLLSGADRAETGCGALTEIPAESGDAQTFQVMFDLPADAGLEAAEFMVFTFSAMDDLDNESRRITGENRFEIFQGDLPPLSAPDDFTAQSLAGGKIRLSWTEIEESAGYQIYRKAPGEEALTLFARTLDTDTFTDDPVANAEPEGLYTYALASIRQIGELESLSPLSDPVSALSDATAPDMPANFTLELTGQGIRASWDGVEEGESLLYTLYRDAQPVTSVLGMTALIQGIAALEVLDPSPIHTAPHYGITAVDEAQNESEPATAYLNAALLPVSGMAVVQEDEKFPVISWTHGNAGVSGFDIYSGPDPTGTQLNDALITQFSYEDTGYTSDSIQYAVVAVDEVNSAVSLARSLWLPETGIDLLNKADITDFQDRLDEILVYVPDLETRIAGLSPIRRGLMNRLEFLVGNFSETPLDPVQVMVDIGGNSHISDPFALEAGEYRVVPVVMGGYAQLEDLEAMAVTIDISPTTSDQVRIIQNREVQVRDGMLIAGILNEEFTRGGTGEVRFTLENTGQESIEIITANSGGSSDEIRFRLLDEDGNVSSTAAFVQKTGLAVTTLPNGDTVAKIDPGDIFTSDAVQIQVPAAISDTAQVELAIDRIHYGTGSDSEVSMSGLTQIRELTLVDTSYYGQVLSISPEVSFGDEEIVISGRAVDRATGLPKPDASLNLVIKVNGFERTFRVLTGEDGSFAYSFVPLEKESGLYQVFAVHPDLTDRSPQGEFTIHSLAVSPLNFNIRISRNYTATGTVTLLTGGGTSLTNVKLLYQAQDQPSGELATGLHLDPGDGLSSLCPGTTKALDFTLWADNTADSQIQAVLKVVSDESGDDGWQTIDLNINLSQASPVLTVSPGVIETGVAQEETRVESLMLKNTGLEILKNPSLSLVLEDGTPAPEWVRLNTPAAYDQIEVGQEKQVDISFAPTSSVTQGYYTFYLRIQSDNYAQTDVGLLAAVTNSGQGNILFKVSDIYTGTFDEANELRQGLENARIRLINDALPDIDQTLTTDDLGEALFQDLPAGSYQCRISADEHLEYTGRFWIRPGITASQDIFLDYQLVSVQWEVVPTTITDKYEIVLTTTFVTDVPAPVVVVEPASVYLPKMSAGDVYNGEFTLVNYGLIQADDLSFTLPQGNDVFQYELLSALPEAIAPNGRVTVPFRVTCLSAPDGSEDTGAGGCRVLNQCTEITYGWECANGTESLSGALHCIIYDNGECDAGSGGSTGFSSGFTVDTTYLSGGSGSGTGSSIPTPAQAPDDMEGILCEPEPNCRACDECCNSKTSQTVSSYVDLMRGKYLDYVNDMSVKVMGHTIDITRYYNEVKHYTVAAASLQAKAPASKGAAYAVDSYSKRNWHINSLGGKAQVVRTSGGTIRYLYIDGLRFEPVTDTLESDGTVTYSAPSSSPGTRAGCVAVDPDQTMVWKDERGNWAKFTGDRLDTFGNANDVTIHYVYDDEERLTGIKDHFGDQVIWYDYNSDGQVVRIRDYDGRQVSYEYNSQGKMAGVTDLLGRETRYEYDDLKRIIKKELPSGKTVLISYNANSYISSIKDAEGNGPEFEYTQNSDTTTSAMAYSSGIGTSRKRPKGKTEYYARVTTETGKITEKWFDVYGYLKKQMVNGEPVTEGAYDDRTRVVSDALGNVTTYAYDEWENLTSVTHPDGTSVTYEYDTLLSKVVKKTDERGMVTTYEYDEKGNLLNMVQAPGTDVARTIEYTHDAYGNILTHKVPGEDGTQDAVTTFGYDTKGNLNYIKDPEGNEISATGYDSLGNPETVTDGRGKTWQFEYDDQGRLTSRTDPAGHAQRFVYDDAGRTQSFFDEEDRQTLYEYDGSENLVRIQFPDHHEFNLVYDDGGNLVRMVDAEGKTNRLGYDDQGRLSQITNGDNINTVLNYGVPGLSQACPSCNVAGSNQIEKIDFPTFSRSFEYDSRGMIVKQTDLLSDALSHESSFAYDPAGNLIFREDRQGNPSTFEYDSLGRIKKVINANGEETAYLYDNRDNLIGLEDAKGQITRFEYDLNNRLKKEIRPMGQVTSYDYDGAGNLVEKIDAENQKTRFVYSDANNLVTVRYYSADDYSEPVKEILFDYDKSGKLTAYSDGSISGTYWYDAGGRKISQTVNYGSFSKSHAYTYDANGLKVSYTGPDQVTRTYQYDGANQLSGITIPGVGTISYNGFLWMTPTGATLPGGTRQTFTHDPLMRPLSIKVSDPGGNPVTDAAVTLDNMGNIIGQTSGTDSFSYTYDRAYQLLGVAKNGTVEEDFAYDLVGNRTHADGVTGEITVNANNELVSYGGISQAFDANGNLIRKTENGNTISYVYNVTGRLVQVWAGDINTGTLTAEYGYDPFGKRLWKEVEGVRTWFYYSDEGLAGEYDAAGNEIRTYDYKPGSGWTTDPVFMQQGGNIYFYHNNHLGTPLALTDIYGTVVWKATARAFGKTDVMVEQVVNNLRFPGQYYDAETGLHYNWNRYYDPETGRYTRVDPLGFEGGSVMFYGYASNNPMTLVDPEGEFFIMGSMVLGAAIGALMGGQHGILPGIAGAVIGAVPVVGIVLGPMAAKAYEQHLKGKDPTSDACVIETMVEGTVGWTQVPGAGDLIIAGAKSINNGGKMLKKHSKNWQEAYDGI